jgi:hypothetical protein
MACDIDSDMSDITLDFSGLLAIATLAVFALVSTLIALVLWVRTPTVKERAGRPRLGEPRFRLAIAGSVTAAATLGAAAIMLWVAAEQMVAPESLQRCDRWAWLWLFPATAIWLATRALLGPQRARGAPG